MKIPRPIRTPQPYWTRDQVEKILATTRPHYRPAFHFFAETGCRIGEAVWLGRGDVDLATKVVHIRPKEGCRPRTGDQRVSPLSAQLCSTLVALQRLSKWVFTAPVTARFPKPGRQISDRRALAHLKVVLKKLGLPGHLHTFRHSFISHALISGAQEAVVREWIGHVDAEIMKLYTHIADRHSKKMMDQILPAGRRHQGSVDAGNGD